MKKIITLAIFLGLFGVTANNSFAAYFNSAPINTCNKQISESLSFGSSGDDVYSLQEMLYRGGYLNTTPNGYFGYATRTAVRSFQRDNNISVTGTVGSVTVDAVNERLCDNDVRAGSYSSYYSYGYNSGVTYVDPYDPYVKVVAPEVQAPSVYLTPQNGVSSASVVYSNSNSNNSNYSNNNLYSITPATTNTSATNANIIYSPNIGYTYGITPSSGSVTITSPSANVIYNEGDTVNLNWSTNNFNASQFQVILENINTKRSQVISTVTGNSYSFVLTRDLLDVVCAGSCNSNQTSQQDSYRIILATPYSDLAGNVSTFKAAIAPVTINRPYSYYGTSSLTTSKSPVNSGETFKLYVNIPTGSNYNSNLSGQFSLKISAVCPSGITVNIGGLGCGQDFIVPQGVLPLLQQQIPVTASNLGWFGQSVSFNLTVFNIAGQVISTASTTAQVNPVPRTI